MKQKLISIVIPYRFVNGKFQVWMQTRQSDDELNGLLEFPGGKVEAGESTMDAAIREVLEEVGVELTQKQLVPYTIYSNNLTDKIVNLSVFFCQDNTGQYTNEGWYNLGTMDELLELKDRIPPANIQFLNQFIINCDFNKLTQY